MRTSTAATSALPSFGDCTISSTSAAAVSERTASAARSSSSSFPCSSITAASAASARMMAASKARLLAALDSSSTARRELSSASERSRAPARSCASFTDSVPSFAWCSACTWRSMSSFAGVREGAGDAKGCALHERALRFSVARAFSCSRASPSCFSRSFRDCFQVAPSRSSCSRHPSVRFFWACAARAHPLHQLRRLVEVSSH